MTILKEQVAAVLDRRRGYEEAEAYYEGDVPETFATAKLRRAFRATGDSSRLNYCRPVIDAVNDRLEISNVLGDTQRASDALMKAWRDNEMDLEAQEIHKKALTFGDCYVAVWPGDDGEMLIGYNSPKNMTLVYDPENPRKKLYAVKMWQQDEQTARLNIYTEDKITKWSAQTSEVTDGTNWSHLGTDDNPFGEVPVFHFRTQRPYGRPEHYDAYDAQNAVNKLFITNMLTIDYQGAPQRYALSNFGNDAEFEDFNEGADTDRENIGSLKNGPGELWYLKGVNMVGEFKPADPDVFWGPIVKTVNAMAALTNTPLHYFDKTGFVPTGNAFRVAEAPLLKKVKDRQTSFGATWRELCKFILKVEGVKSDVLIVWKTVESLDELERWDVTLKKINAGLSHQQALREGGYPEEQITKIMAEAHAENEAGLSYQRKAVTRVNVNQDETAPTNTTTGEANTGGAGNG